MNKSWRHSGVIALCAAPFLLMMATMPNVVAQPDAKAFAREQRQLARVQKYNDHIAKLQQYAAEREARQLRRDQHYAEVMAERARWRNERQAKAQARAQEKAVAKLEHMQVRAPQETAEPLPAQESARSVFTPPPMKTVTPLPLSSPAQIVKSQPPPPATPPITTTAAPVTTTHTAAMNASSSDERDTPNAREIDLLGFTLHGNITSLTGWQSYGPKALNVGNAPRGVLGDQLANVSVDTNKTVFGFFLDQAEIDIERDIKDIAHFRVDLDIAPSRDVDNDGDNKDVRDVIDLEQAYVHLSSASGLNLALGRFNSEFGIDPVDRADLTTISFSNAHRHLLPHNLTGGMLALRNDALDIRFLVMQDLNDATATSKSAIPTLGLQMKYAWGDDDARNWVKFSGAAGPQTSSKSVWTYLADLSAQVWIHPHLQIAVDGTYRDEHHLGCGDGHNNCKYLAAAAQFVMPINEKFGATVRAGYLRDFNNGPLLTASQAIYDGTIAFNYYPWQGMRVGFEYRLDYAKPMGSIASRGTAHTHGVGLLASYSF